MNLSYSIPKAEENILNGVKIHTIREDNTDRWKQGMKIHHCYSFRSKDGYRCFLQGECKSTQLILIVFDVIHGILIAIDRVHQREHEIELLAKNDGFESVQQMIDWFLPKDKNGKRTKWTFSGKIIHWTDFKYTPYEQTTLKKQLQK